MCVTYQILILVCCFVYLSAHTHILLNNDIIILIVNICAGEGGGFVCVCVCVFGRQTDRQTEIDLYTLSHTCTC